MGRHPGPGRRILALALSLVPAIVAVGCGTDDPEESAGPASALAGASAPTWLVERAGGLTTTFEVSQRSFSLSARNLGLEDRARFAAGDEIFERHYTVEDGLGPDFNATSCTSCHVDNGRFEGAIEDGELAVVGPVVHVSEPGAGPSDPPFSLPGYGRRIQVGSTSGEPEASVTVGWEWIEREYPDGAPYTLRRPVLTIEGARGPIGPDAQVSLRIPPQLAGSGLLGAVDEADIMSLADPDDVDGDGISGRPNRVPAGSGSMALGRFGWKAEQPDLVRQSAAALSGDIGIETGVERRGAPTELDETSLADLAFYVEALAVPAGRAVDDPEVVAGAGLFTDVGCAACHVPALTTSIVEVRGLSEQHITPFTDLLLHDLGPGLSDDRPVHEATGAEWRTAPLWGIGLLLEVNDQLNLLHDGRARSVEEAILWHGGEASAANDRFQSLNADDRRRLLRFVESR